MATWLELMGADQRPMLVLVLLTFGLVLISIAPGSAIAAATALASLAHRGWRGAAQPAPWNPGDPPIWPKTAPPTDPVTTLRTGA
jgi:hypothetical protein